MDNALISGIFLVLFAVPAYYYFIMSLGWRRGSITIIVLQLFALIVETIAIKTGFPYGHFTYSHSLGYKLFDTTPWSVGLSWSMIVIGAAVIVQRYIKKKYLILPAYVLILLVTDVVLDPGAVALGYWKYANTNGFYNVPFTNFLGWILSGTIGCSLFLILVSKKKLNSKCLLSLLCVILFWTGVDFYKSLFIPASIGVVLSGVSIMVLRWEYGKESVYSKESVNN